MSVSSTYLLAKKIAAILQASEFKIIFGRHYIYMSNKFQKLSPLLLLKIADSICSVYIYRT